MKPVRETLGARRPLELAAYLRSRGWWEAERLGERAAVWLAKRGGEELEILLPLEATLGNYLPRMAEVLSTLEAFEARPRSAILDDVATTADTVRFRFVGRTFDQHAVTVEHGVHLYENVRELLLAVACAAIGPRPVFSTRKPARALEYLSTLQLASPSRLHAASSGALQPFHEEVASAVSANLSEALAGLVARSGARMCEVTLGTAMLGVMLPLLLVGVAHSPFVPLADTATGGAATRFLLRQEPLWSLG
jgi:hypothetical protein